MSLAARLHVGSPKDTLSSEDVADFAMCERLLNTTYRLSETGHREDRNQYFTDDTVIEMHYRDAPEKHLYVAGKDAVLAWYDGVSNARQDRGQGPRLHVTTNFIWAKTAPDEVVCNNVLTYYEFPEGPSSDAPSGAPRLIADCVHRFRLEDGIWRMSYKYYWILYTALPLSGIGSP